MLYRGITRTPSLAIFISHGCRILLRILYNVDLTVRTMQAITVDKPINEETRVLSKADNIGNLGRRLGVRVFVKEFE